MTIERDTDRLRADNGGTRRGDRTEMTFTPRQRGLSLAAVIAASFGVGLSFGVGFPLTALTFEAWHQPKWMIGLAGASPAIAVLVALPIMPSLVARLGAVTAIAGGCLAGAVGFLALYAFQSPWAWIAIRLLMSAGFALPWLAGGCGHGEPRRRLRHWSPRDRDGPSLRATGTISRCGVGFRPSASISRRAHARRP